jgi:hypothetical protein
MAQAVVLLLLVIGIVFCAISYQKKMIKNVETRTVVEHRFIPRSIYEEQFGQVNLQQSFHDMFEGQDVYRSLIVN